MLSDLLSHVLAVAISCEQNALPVPMSTIKIDGPLMNELRQKPEGSHIEETETFDGRTYRWKPPSGGPLRFFIAGFLSLWLVGWCAGFVAAANVLIKGGNINKRFLAIWLAARDPSERRTADGGR